MRYMKEHGFDVIMVSSEGKEWADIIRNEGCARHIIHMTRRITPLQDLVSLWRLFRYFKRERPEIVHTHTPKAGLLGMLAAKMAGIPVRVHTVAGLRFMTAGGFKRSLLISMERLTSHTATRVWPNSFSLLEYIRQNKLSPGNKLELIGRGSSNGIDLGRFSREALQPGKLEIIKQRIHFDESLMYLLCAGRIVRDKGIEELAKAFVKCFEKNNKLRLLLAGSFEDHLDPVSAETQKILHNHPGVILAGWSDEVEYYMSFAFALIHPSHREGFPNVLLQAGAMLCPVICSRIEGNVDIVEDEKTGLLFQAKNENALYQRLQDALDHPEWVRNCTISLREKIEQYYSQQVVHSLMKDKYMELLKEGHKK